MSIQKFLWLCTLSVISLSQLHGSLLNQTQVINYIQNVVDTLLMTQESGCSQEINRFKKQLQNKILSNIGQRSWLVYTKYDSDKVYQVIVGEIEQFIEEQAFEYALIELSSRRGSSTHKQITAKKIKQAIFQEVHKLIMSSSYLDDGRLLQYVGPQLKSKVKALIPTSYSVQPTHTESKLYPSDECPICYDNFSTGVKRIFLDCGHNLCPTCLTSLYKRQLTDVHCPLCRTPIDIYKYSAELWAPSAPPL